MGKKSEDKARKKRKAKELKSKKHANQLRNAEIRRESKFDAFAQKHYRPKIKPIVNPYDEQDKLAKLRHNLEILKSLEQEFEREETEREEARKKLEENAEFSTGQEIDINNK